MRRHVLKMLAVLMAACLAFPQASFAAMGDTLAAGGLQAQSTGKATLSVTYPYADSDDDGSNDYSVEAGTLSNNFKFSYFSAESVSDPSDGKVTARFPVNVASSAQDCFYRVTNAVNSDAVSYGNYIVVPFLAAGADEGSSDRAVEVTLENLCVGDAGSANARDKGTVVRDFTGNAYDTGDIYLNVAPSGHVKLNVGGSFTLCPLRNWLAVADTMNQGLLQPDFHVEVINLEGAGAVTATESTASGSSRHSWTIKGVSTGTALVKVTYDAMTHNSAMGKTVEDGVVTGGNAFSAIWPENTGLFVVTVGKSSNVQAGFTLNAQRNGNYERDNAAHASDKAHYGNSAKNAGDELDAELDVLYYVGDSGASYTFAPEEGAQVSVARGSIGEGSLQVGEFTQEGVETAADGAVTVNGLTSGKHVIRVQKDGNAVYQVIRAKAVSYKVYAGDTETAGKLAYDSAAGALYAYTDGAAPITRAAYEALDEGARDAYEPLLESGGKALVVFDTLYHPANKLSGCYNMTPAISLSGSDGAVFEQSVSPYGGDAQYEFASKGSCQRIGFSLPSTTADGAYTLSGALLSTGYGYDGYGSHRLVSYADGRTPSSANAPLYAAYFGQLPEITLDVVAIQGADPDPDPDPVDDEATKAQKAADSFAALVNGIGTVDLNDSARIVSARAAYSALSSAAKDLVSPSTVSALEKAESQLAALRLGSFSPKSIASGCVRVIVENPTWSTAAGAPWDGVLIDQQVKATDDDNIRTLVDKALVQAGKAKSGGAANYLNAIEGLGDPGSGAAYNGNSSGWMATLNGWFINAGMNSFTVVGNSVRAGDEVHLVYTSDGGPDVGSSATLMSKELAGIALGEGSISPAFSPSAREYVLTVPKGTSAVHLKPIAKNPNFQVRTYVGAADAYDAGYRFNDAIPVSDGTTLTVVVGDSSWPSMNSSALPAETYRVFVVCPSSSPDPDPTPDDPGTSGDDDAKKAAEKAAADKKAAAAVTTAIDKLPAAASTTDANAKAVKAARKAYKNLTAAQKKLVKAAKLKKLTACEAAVASTVTLKTATVTKAAVTKALKSVGNKAAGIKKIILGVKVKKIGASSFAKLKNGKTIIVKTKKLTKASVKGSLAKSKVTTLKVSVGKAKANKTYVAKYKKIFTKMIAGKKVTVKAA